MKAKIGSALGLPRDIARRVVGGWALVWDSTAGVVRAPAVFMEQVERRGVDVEKNVGEVLRGVQQSSVGGWQRVRSGAMQPLRWVRREAVEGSHLAEDEVERQVERVLERMGIPTRERLDRLGREIDALTLRIEAELVRMAENDPRVAA